MPVAARLLHLCFQLARELWMDEGENGSMKKNPRVLENGCSLLTPLSQITSTIAERVLPAAAGVVV
jgi:hypothetical protein